MILYVAQAYSKYDQVPRDAYDMHDAYALAINTYWTLTKMGFEVFSPIMYTHPFHLAMKHPPIDYVTHDLALLESWLKNDYDDCILDPANNGNCEEIVTSDWEAYYQCCNCELRKERQYDSGVCCVFADDCWINRSNFNCTCAYSHKDHCEGYPKDGCTWEWNSNGAKAEYDFAHAHHIKCIRLTELLEIYQEAKERYSLKQPTSRDDILKRIIEECEPF
jgi:hypothetical protein